MPLLELLLQPAMETFTLSTDDQVVTESCTVEVAADWIADEALDGVLTVRGDGVVVDFGGAELRGSPPGLPPERQRGCGIVVEGSGVTLRNARISGFRVGVWARGADGLVLEDCAVEGGFRQRLLSTPQSEDLSDWLVPHENDSGEWRERYGAAFYVQDAADVTVRGCRARRVQNGIVLDRVAGARVYDNDCSFLSGWGLALWRSDRNTITRNAFDYCVRGYSHGIYNRGQDSAGILLFEQCSRNVIAENSATHCGDGVFIFAGREALGQAPPPADDFDYAERGCNRNLIFGNDLSHCVAHGLELTFSFRNTVANNRMAGNAICGLWGGYSQRTKILHNEFEANGDMAVGLERGGVNIEHGSYNRIAGNSFSKNACGVYLWWDEDPELAALPWAKANGVECTKNRVYENEFSKEQLAVQVRAATKTYCDSNVFREVAVETEFTDGARPALAVVRRPGVPQVNAPELLGDSSPVGAHSATAGRRSIVMTPYGPYDFSEPYLHVYSRSADGHEYRLFGPHAGFTAEVEGDVELELEERTDPPRLTVRPLREGELVPYRLRVTSDGRTFERSEHLFAAPWVVWVFGWKSDPQLDLDAWHREAGEEHETMVVPALELPYGYAGPSEVPMAPVGVRVAHIPSDFFGTIATSKIRVPAGDWVLRTRSDDGVRLWADGELLIDNWTHHPPTTDEARLHLDEMRSVDLRVEHFELVGAATLSFEIAPAETE